MAQPKSKVSRSRRGMRNSHTRVHSDFATTCPTTGELHRPHRAFKASDGAIYFKGKQITPTRD